MMSNVFLCVLTDILVWEFVFHWYTLSSLVFTLFPPIVGLCFSHCHYLSSFHNICAWGYVNHYHNPFRFHYVFFWSGDMSAIDTVHLVFHSVIVGVADAYVIINRCEKEYPESALFMFFKGRAQRLEVNTNFWYKMLWEVLLKNVKNKFVAVWLQLLLIQAVCKQSRHLEGDGMTDRMEYFNILFIDGG